MGIAKLWTEIKKKAHDAFKDCTYEDIKGKPLVIEGQGKMYQFIRGGKSTTMTIQWDRFIKGLVDNGNRPLVVFDGKKPMKKAEQVSISLSFRLCKP